MTKATEIFLYGSYYLITALFCVWIYANWLIARKLKFSLWNFIKENAIGLIAALVWTGVIFISVQPNFRVQADESLLLAVSKAMTQNRTVSQLDMMIRDVDGSIVYEMGNLPKRPLLFPYLTHLVHLIRGYQPANVFFINFLTLFTLLAGVYVAIRAALGKSLAFWAVPLVLAQPIVAISATSGGFDLFAVTFLGVIFILLFQFLKNPSPASQALLWINLLAYCHTRYEALPLTCIILAFLVIFRCFKFAYMRPYWALYALTPLLLLPRLLQIYLTPNQYENPEGVPAFAWDHAWQHLAGLVRSQLDFSFTLPFANIINIAAFVIGCCLVAQATPARLKDLRGFCLQFICIAVSCVALSLISALAFHAGDPSQPIAARYFLVFAVACSLMPFVALKAGIGISHKLVFAVAGLTFVLYHPIASKDQFLHSNMMRKLEIVQDGLGDTPKQDILIVSSVPVVFVAADYNAVTFSYANLFKEKLLADLKGDKISEIYMVQEFDYATGRTNPVNKIDEDYPLETLYQLPSPNGNSGMIRLARVKK